MPVVTEKWIGNSCEGCSSSGSSDSIISALRRSGTATNNACAPNPVRSAFGSAAVGQPSMAAVAAVRSALPPQMPTISTRFANAASTGA